MKRRLFLLAFLLGGGMAAQSITGSITGIVTDPTGGVIPGATVEVTNKETGIRVVVKSDASGNYTAPQLPRGQYRVEVIATGFKKAVHENIEVQVYQTVRLDIQMAVGEVTEAVSVSADVQRLETENATLSKVVDNNIIVNMPFNTRNVYTLVFLTPGVTGTVGNSYGEMRYSVNGARARTMDTLIDGVTAAHPTVNGFAGISVFPSVDAIEEFKLLGADYPAEFGRSLGSVAQRGVQVRHQPVPWQRLRVSAQLGNGRQQFLRQSPRAAAAEFQALAVRRGVSRPGHQEQDILHGVV